MKFIVSILLFLFFYGNDNPKLYTAELLRRREEITYFYVVNLYMSFNTGWLWFFISEKVGKGTWDFSLCYRLPSLHCNDDFNHLDYIIILMNVMICGEQFGQSRFRSKSCNYTSLGSHEPG